MVWRCSSCGHQNLGRHKLCQGCGNPKDASERYEMPSDTAAAETVTAPELLRLATAGPNWQCGFCGSHQRRLDGECAQCGAAQQDGRDLRPPTDEPAGDTKDAERAFDPEDDAVQELVGKPTGTRWKVAGAAGALAAVVGFFGLGGEVPGLHADGPKTHYVARVGARRWERVVTVERYRQVTQEAFAENIPSDAEDRTGLGQRHHHNEEVRDGFDTEHYTERVRDGYDTEHYTERVACGRDCSPRPQRCREVCTPNENGFATCRDHCTGGGQDCTTRYCNESRTRRVPRYRDERRTRQVPRYRTVSRTAEWYSYRVWRWGEDRVVRAAGSGPTEPRWPSAEEIHLSEGLADGEREREQRSETFEVTLRAGSRDFVSHPASAAAFGSLQADTAHFVRVQPSGGFVVEGPADGTNR
ncbi:MAG: hypothetical protein R3B40_28100 [Polyangiales bacterium]|nr:hypothetical protein [Myxococcales bacterium]